MDRILLAIPSMGPKEAANLQKCIDDNFVSSVGPFVTEFEERVASLSGSKHGVAMGAGTQALHMALHAVGVRPDDLVILPSFTFIASANAIAHTGALPWLFDIDPTSWTIDAAQVGEALRNETEREADGTLRHKSSGRRVAAMMPVYTLGTPADMGTLGALAKEFGLPLIADAAAAIGVNYKGKPIGPMADVTCYSFNGNKTITCGGGGMAVGDDEALMKHIRHISTTARVSRDYEHDVVGWNYRMTNVQAAIGCAQAERLDDFLETKTRIRRMYDEAFAGDNRLSLFPAPSDRESTYWFSGFVLNEDAGISAAEVCEALSAHNIEARTFWRPVHLQPPYANAPRQPQAVTEDIWQRIVTLPCSTSLSPSDQDKVIRTVFKVLGAPLR